MTVIEHLRTELANSLVLWANYKHYHWQLAGPSFRDLHLLFDDFASQIYETVDDLAERMRMLDEDVDLITLTDYAEAATVEAASAGQDAREMVDQAHVNAMVVIQEMRDAVKVAEEEEDAGSVDLFSKFVQIHERQSWFLRQILKKAEI